MDTILTIAGAALTVIIVPSISWVIMKFNHIDVQLQNKMEEPQVRRLIEDKFDPVQEDLHELKEKIDKIFDHLLNKRQ